MSAPATTNANNLCRLFHPAVRRLKQGRYYVPKLIGPQERVRCRRVPVRPVLSLGMVEDDMHVNAQACVFAPANRG